MQIPPILIPRIIVIGEAMSGGIPSCMNITEWIIYLSFWVKNDFIPWKWCISVICQRKLFEIFGKWLESKKTVKLDHAVSFTSWRGISTNAWGLSFAHIKWFCMFTILHSEKLPRLCTKYLRAGSFSICTKN